jgi:hypothetical protein
MGRETHLFQIKNTEQNLRYPVHGLQAGMQPEVLFSIHLLAFGQVCDQFCEQSSLSLILTIVRSPLRLSNYTGAYQSFQSKEGVPKV